MSQRSRQQPVQAVFGKRQRTSRLQMMVQQFASGMRDQTDHHAIFGSQVIEDQIMENSSKE